MKITFYVLPGKFGLKFSDPTERDKFWGSMSKLKRNGFTAAQMAERVGTRTIRFHADRAKEGFEWNLSNGEAVEVPVKAAPTSADVQKVAPPPEPQSVITSNPFGFKTGAAHKPLPGLVPAPPQEMLAKEQSVEQKVGAAPEPVAQAAPVDDDPKPVGVHHRSKAMNEWRERQKAKNAKV